MNDDLIVSHVLAVHQQVGSDVSASRSVLDSVLESRDGPALAERLLATRSEAAVLFFALAIVERCARRRWAQLERVDRVRLRDGIAAYAVASNSVDDVVTRKAVQVHVAIGKAEWPHDNAAFLADIGALAADAATAQLGLYWLAVAAEDLVAAADTTVSAARQRELRRLLEAETPAIVAFLAERLAQPPLAALVLDALARFIALLPLHLVPLDSFRDRLFAFVLRGAAGDGDDLALAMRALACVVEIFSRSFVPAEAERAFVGQFESVCAVLQSVAGVADLGRVDADFLAQLVHVLHLLVSVHIARLERLAEPLMLPFLALLARFSAAMALPELFLQCVDVWFALLDHCQTQLVSRGGAAAADAYIGAYRGSVLGFAAPLLERVQQACVVADGSAAADDDEVDAFIVRCIELLVQMAQLYPGDVVPAAHGWCFAQTAAALQGALVSVDAATLRVAATGFRVLGALADLFDAPAAAAAERAELARSAFERGVAVARACAAATPPTGDALRLQAQTLGFFDAFTPWLAANAAPELVNELLALAFPAVESPDATVSELAAKLIRSLAEKVCREGFLAYAPMGALVEQFAATSAALCVGARRQLAVACGAALLNDANFGGYAQFVGAVVSPLTDDAVLLGADLCRAVGGASHAQRRAATDAFVPILEACFVRFGGLLGDPARLAALIELVSVAFESLHKELNEAFTQAAAQAFLQLFDDPAALQSVVASANEDAAQLLCRYLSFMARLAAEPPAAKSGLAAGLIAFAGDRLWPVVRAAGAGAVDVAVELLGALFKVTLAHYKWMQRDAESAADAPLHAALRVMAAALGGDIAELAVVRAAVENLRALQDKLRALERSPLRGSIAVAVLALLAGRAHDVLREPLLELLHAIVVHDLASFTAHIAPAVLIQRQLSGADASAALDELCAQLAADQPTFFEVVSQFTDAIHRIELAR